MNKLIIVEGTRGGGKTTITSWLREVIPYSNLLRLSGIKDKSLEGKEKVARMRYSEIDYCDSVSECDINIIMDRCFMTEYVYSNLLGYTKYDFSDYFKDMCYRVNGLNYDMYLIKLVVRDMSLLEERLKREKANHGKLVFSVEESVKQMEAYDRVVEEFIGICSNVKVIEIDTSVGIEEVKRIIQEKVINN